MKRAFMQGRYSQSAMRRAFCKEDTAAMGGWLYTEIDEIKMMGDRFLVFRKGLLKYVKREN